MKSSYFTFKNIFVLFLSALGLAGLLKGELLIAMISLVAAGTVFATGPQLQLNTGASFSYLTDTEKATGKALSLIRCSFGILFLMSGIGGYFKQDYYSGSLLFAVGIALYSPLASLIFYNGGYITKTEMEYASVKKFHYWFLIARNAGILLLLIGFGLTTENDLTSGKILFLSGSILLLSVPALLLIRRKQLVTSYSMQNVLLGRSGQTITSSSYTPAAPVTSPLTETSIPPASPSLQDEFKQLSVLDPHKRGYAFQHFLIRLFNESELNARAAFRVTGEELDGSFELDGNIYLLEAKWQQDPCSGSALRDFNGKVEGKASWARGIIVCYSGFSEEAIKGFVMGKRLNIIGMDGRDIEEILKGKINLKEAIKRKVRLAGERNSFFIPVKELL